MTKLNIRNPGRLALANISLGAAFGVASVFSSGTKLLSFLGLTSLLRILQPYQQHLVLAFVSYWIPAICIYLLLRLLRVDRRLGASWAVHVPIALGNLLLVLYVGARVLASTVQGGGASFVVVSFSRFFIFPAWGLLGVGFAILVIQSIAARRTDHPDRRVWNYAEFAMLGCAVGVPLAFAFFLPLERMYTLSTEFSRLCKNAEIKIYETVNPAKSVVLTEDRFTHMPPRRQAETLPHALFLLNQSFLEFIERPASKESGIADKAQYERIATVGERILRSQPGSSAQTTFSYEPTDTITAEYEVRPIRLTIEKGADVGLGGARIEIRRRADDKLIAHAQYYWNNTEFRACPEESHRGLFIYHFIANALNVRNPSVPTN